MIMLVIGLLSIMNGKSITWKHLKDLYDAKCGVSMCSQGLFFANKALQRAH